MCNQMEKINDQRNVDSPVLNVKNSLINNSDIETDNEEKLY